MFIGLLHSFPTQTTLFFVYVFTACYCCLVYGPQGSNYTTWSYLN